MRMNPEGSRGRSRPQRETSMGRATGRKLISVAAMGVAIGLAAVTGCTAETGDPAPQEHTIATAIPPKNPWLTDSEYPITHFDSAASDSTSAAGPTVAKQLSESDVRFVPTTYSSNPTIKYSGDDRIVFAPTMYGIQKILATGDKFEPVDFLPYPGAEAPSTEKLDALLEKTDAAVAADDDAALVALGKDAEEAGITYGKISNGAYNMIDKDGFHYSVIEGMRILKTTDDGDPHGPMRFEKVVELQKAPLPAGTSPEAEAAVHGPTTSIVALGMTYDGHIVAGSHAALFLLNRDLEVLSVLPFSGEKLENNFAIDKTGIYAVTSRRMLKVVWTGSALSIDEKDGGWSAEYETSDPAIATAAGSLTRSGGSGTTPTLMGFGPGDDELVIISDAAATGPSLVAFWRNEIPAGDDRIAGTAQVDVSNVTLELSPTVLGEDVLATTTAYPEPAPNVWANTFAPGATRAAPHGMQKYHWNSTERKFDRMWTNTEVDNSDITVASVSSRTGLLYAADKHEGRYSYVGIDWETGETVARWTFPDESRRWNLFGGMIVPIGDGQFIAGGMLSIKRVFAE